MLRAAASLLLVLAVITKGAPSGYVDGYEQPKPMPYNAEYKPSVYPSAYGPSPKETPDYGSYSPPKAVSGPLLGDWKNGAPVADEWMFPNGFEQGFPGFGHVFGQGYPGYAQKGQEAPGKAAGAGASWH
ncbi:hypothetical protein L596_009142 [Steinernema carpocapsae]|uniref:Secreted protein n=1 Tax=Steinernema carpocapsae TaxID=34508 RepID=A0A4U5PFB2_STECR|nr:hypothetical protein L596_009142 [Steinernema carpocapsae]